MRRIKVLRTCAIVTAATVFLTIGCGPAGGNAPATADVKAAFGSMNSPMYVVPHAESLSWSSATSFSNTITSGGGSVTYQISSPTDPTAGSYTITETVTVTNWKDPTTGYTINGVVNMVSSCSFPLGWTTFPFTITATVKGTLSLSGGPISTLGMDVAVAMTMNGLSSSTQSQSGTITANGYVFDISKLE
jgi:hypothetical protein